MPTARTSRPANAGSGASADLSGLAAALDALASLCDLTGPGDAGTFGDDLAGIVADGIKDRADRQSAPDGSTWEANRGEYGKAKRRRGLRVGVGLREGEPRMLDRAELLGEVEVTPDRAVMTPGTTDFARKKVGWFSDGNDANNQPARELVGLDPAIESDLARRVDRQVADGIRKLGAGG